MKFFALATSTLALAASFIEAVGVHVRDPDDSLAPLPPACTDPRTATPLHRAYSYSATDNFYTANGTEFTNTVEKLRYTNKGIAGWVFPYEQCGTVPLYCLNAISFNGYNDEGVVGYVYPSASCGGLALWRLYSANASDHFYTMLVVERDRATVSLDYMFEGNAGFILLF
ncbi:hypothetical protein BDQ17DRAFT_1393413 [Cyathus striatus]|nr:hypothetical protein BDQ17DRAFT_1393413 [Cyathus striatus]